MMVEGKKFVLITGSRGLIGGCLYDQLKGRQAFQVIRSEADLTDPAAVDEELSRIPILSAIIHCAAIVPTQEVLANPSRAFDVNCAGTFNLAYAATQNHPDATFVYLSTSHVYEPSNRPLSESDKTKPNSLYGLTKFIGEQIVEALFCDRKFLIFRIFSVISEQQPHSFLYPSLIKKIGEALNHNICNMDLEGGDSTRNFSSPELVAKQIISIFAAGESGAFNVGSENNQSILQLAESIARGRIQFKCSGVCNSMVPDLSKFRSVEGDDESQQNKISG